MKHKLTSVLTMLILCNSLVSYALDYMSIIDSMSANGAAFNEITIAVDEAWEGEFQGKHSGRKQYERWKFYHSTRLDENGRLTNSAKQRWNVFYSSESKNSAGSNKAAEDFSGNWTSMGKTEFNHYPRGYSGGMGRVNCIAFDPANNNIIYVGTPGGGLWRSVDGGNSWDPMIDGMPRLGVSGIVIDPSSPEANRTIYILTGDGDGKDTQSLGVYKSIDNGSTWMSTGLGANIEYGYKLLMHPTNYNILYAATQYGVYKTENGGLNWSLQTLPGYLDWDYVTDIEFNTANPEILYASTLKSSVFTTTNGGQSWTKLSGVILPSEADVYESRAAVAVTPANPDYIYILYGTILTEYRFGGLYLSTDGGQSFTLKSNYPNILGGGQAGMEINGQSAYDLTLAVSPANANEVHVGAINSWKSVDGGISWAITSYWVEYQAGVGNYTHADFHALEFDSDNNFYCGTDGGIYKSADFAENWNNLSFGLEITQFYRIGGKANNPDVVLGGAQDNGSMLMDNTNTMHQWYGGDGFECMFSPDQEGTFYGSYQYGGLFKTTDGGNNRYTITPRSSTGGLLYGAWLTPYTLDPINSDIIYAGYNEIHKSTDGGSSWTDITNGAIEPNSKFFHIMVSEADPNYIFALKTNKLYRTTDGGATWEQIPQLINANYQTSGFTLDKRDVNKFWTYNYQGIYKTTDGGATWEQLPASGLPSQWKHSIVNQYGSNDGVYVGTDAGVYYIDNNMTSWLNFSNGLVNVEIFELEINYQSKKIRAATYGRGVWESDMYINCEDGTTVSIPAPAGKMSKAIGISYIIEAENFVSTTGTFNDSQFGGPGLGVNRTGTNINYVNTGDVAVYNLPTDFESGVYEVDYYISTPMNQAAIALSVDNGTAIMTDAVPNNGEWDSYQIMAASQQITLQHGVNSTITISGAGNENWEWNLDRFVLTKVEEITIPVIGVSLSDDTLSIEANNSHQLIADVEPGNASNTDVTWSSDNPSVVSVNNGLVTALAAGEATITVTTVSGNNTAECFVSVTPQTYSITFEAEDRSAFGSTFAIYQSSVGIAVEAESGQMGSYQIPAGFHSGEYCVEYYIGSAIEGGIVEFSVDNVVGDFIGPFSTDAPDMGEWDAFEWVTCGQTFMLNSTRNSNIFVRAQGPAGKVWNMDKFRLVRVGDENIPVESLAIESDSVFSVESGQLADLSVRLTPAYASNTSISWSISNPAIAPIPANTYYDNISGIATCVLVVADTGTAVVTATTDDGGYTAEFTLHVTEPIIPVTGVSISDNRQVVGIGGTYQLTATVAPSYAINTQVSWYSDNETVATVNNEGLVTVNSYGEANIVVTTLEGGFTDTCAIIVPVVNEFTVEAESFIATGGTIDDADWGGPGYGINNNGSTINWVNTGDWADYTITVVEGGRYELVYYLATPITTAAIEFSVNGIAYFTDQVTATGDWEVYQPLTANMLIEMYPGNYNLRLRGVGTNGWEWNMDKFTFEKVDEICVSNINLKAFYGKLSGTYAGPMPGLIEELDNENEELGSLNKLLEEFSFYPNPANSQLTVVFNVANEESVNIQIMNIMGEVQATVVSEELSTGSYEMVYDLTNLSAGVYLVRYSNGSSHSIQKLVIE